MLPPLTSVNGRLCFGAVTLTFSGPVPVLVIVMLADAVAAGDALKLSVFGVTEMRPPPGVGTAVGVAVRVAVAVAPVEVAVGVAVAVWVAVGVAVLVAVPVADGVGLGDGVGVDPAGTMSFVMKASPVPIFMVWFAPTVIGKSFEYAEPVT